MSVAFVETWGVYFLCSGRTSVYTYVAVVLVKYGENYFMIIFGMGGGGNMEEAASGPEIWQK